MHLDVISTFKAISVIRSRSLQLMSPVWDDERGLLKKSDVFMKRLMNSMSFLMSLTIDGPILIRVASSGHLLEKTSSRYINLEKPGLIRFITVEFVSFGSCIALYDSG